MLEKTQTQILMDQIDKLKEDNVTLSKQNEKLSAELEKATPAGMEKLKKDNSMLSKRCDKLRESLNDSDKESLDYQKESEDLAKKLKISEVSLPTVKGPEYAKVITTADLKNVRPYKKPEA